MNLDTALRICGPAMIAMMIFAVSPGRYGITPTPSPATKLIPSWPASHAVPNACFHSAVCWLPGYDWQEVHGFTPEEIARYQKIVESTSRKIRYFC